MSNAKDIVIAGAAAPLISVVALTDAATLRRSAAAAYKHAAAAPTGWRPPVCFYGKKSVFYGVRNPVWMRGYEVEDRLITSYEEGLAETPVLVSGRTMPLKEAIVRLPDYAILRLTGRIAKDLSLSGYPIRVEGPGPDGKRVLVGLGGDHTFTI